MLEKPESEKLEGLAPVRSSKAKRLQRSRPGVFNKPGKPIVVRGWEWTAVLLCGLKGAVQVVSMRWWSRKGEQAAVVGRTGQDRSALCAALAQALPVAR